MIDEESMNSGVDSRRVNTVLRKWLKAIDEVSPHSSLLHLSSLLYSDHLSLNLHTYFNDELYYLDPTGINKI